MNTLENLPFDIFEHLCHYLTLHDVHQLKLTCKTLYKYSRNNVVFDKIKIEVLCNDDPSKLRDLMQGDIYFGTFLFHFNSRLRMRPLLKDFLTKFGSRIKNFTFWSEDLTDIRLIVCYLSDVNSLILNETGFLRTANKINEDTNLTTEMCSKFKNLTELSIKKYNFSVTQFPALFQHNSIKKFKLETSNIYDFDFFYDVLSRHSKTLTYLEISGFYSMCPVPLQIIFSLSEFKLLTLNFKFRWADLTDDMLKKLCQSQASLENLTINLRNWLQLKIICDYLLNLQTLKISIDNTICVEDLSCLLNLRKLKSLKIMDPADLRQLLKIIMPNLKCLSIILYLNEGDIESFELLSANFKNLEELNLQAPGIINYHRIQLIFKNLTKLKRLSLNIKKIVLEKKTKVDEMYKISNLRNLEFLKIVSLYQEFPDISDIADLENLKDLDLEISYIRSPSYHEYNKLVTCSKLESVTFVGIRLLDDNLITILSQHSKNLKRVTIVDCKQITEEAEAIIVKNCRFLEKLLIENCFPMKREKEEKDFEITYSNI